MGSGLREWLWFFASFAAACILTAVQVLYPPSSPIWKVLLWGGLVVFAIAAFLLLIDLLRKKVHPLTNRAPKIDLSCGEGIPYEASETINGHLHSVVRIGLKNSGNAHIASWKLYVDGISPEPKLYGGFPIFVKEGGVLRSDDPEIPVELANYWDHHNQYRFSAPIGGGFAETLNYMDAGPKRSITIRVTANQYTRRATFEIWVDESKRLRLRFLGYAE